MDWKTVETNCKVCGKMININVIEKKDKVYYRIDRYYSRESINSLYIICEECLNRLVEGRL